KLTILVLDQRDEAGAVRIVFEPLDGCGHVELATLEVHLAVGLLVTAAAEAHRDAAVVVASAGRVLSFGQLFDRRAAMQCGAVDNDELPLARRSRVIGLECHRCSLTDPWSRRWCDPRLASRSRAWSATGCRPCP